MKESSVQKTRSILQARMGYLTILKSLIQLLWRINRSFFIALVLLALISGVVPALLLFLNATLIGLLFPGPGISSSPSVSIPILLFIIGGGIALGQLFAKLQVAVENLYKKRVEYHISRMIAEKASALDISFFENPEFHNILTNATMEASFRPITLITLLLTALTTLVGLLSTGVILLFWQFWILPLIVLASFLRFWVSSHFGKARAKLMIEQTPILRKAQYLNSLLTSDTSVKEVRLFNLQHFLLQRYRALQDILYEKERKLTRRVALFSTLVEVVMSGVRPLLIGFAALEVLQKVLGLTQFILYTQAITQVEQGLGTLMFTLAQFHENILFITNLFRFLSIAPEIEAPRATAAPSTIVPFQPPMIEFRNVSFSYPETEVQVLHNLSFSIAPGEAVALVGENGAGKTTIVKLLAGFYEPTEGQILFNGVNITTLDRKTLRDCLSVIFQDFSIYHFSVYDNIAIGDVDHLEDRTRVEQAAWRSGLSSLIESFPEQYETLLGRWLERGQELSGGQRQLVALARALMRSAPILILDEPGSALDAKKELDFFQRLLDKQRNREQSVIFISHRFSTVRRADRILVVEHGQLIAQGTHDELMKQRGRYTEMFSIQMQTDGNEAPHALPYDKLSSLTAPLSLYQTNGSSALQLYVDDDSPPDGLPYPELSGLPTPLNIDETNGFSALQVLEWIAYRGKRRSQFRNPASGDI